MYLKLFDVSTCNSVHIQCTGIAYSYITGLWAPSLRNEERLLALSCPFVRTFFFVEVHSGRIPLNLVFETVIETY
jgi:hypothetical protein